MNLQRIILALIIAGSSLVGFSQVGIGTTTPDNSAALHIESSSKGLLIPEISTLPESPRQGLLYFDPARNKYHFFDGENWQVLNPTPIGGIIMWNGSEVPYGWALCDGNYYNPDDNTDFGPNYVEGWVKTPNLLDRFIMGADPEETNNYDKAHRVVTDTTVLLEAENIPSHHHAVNATNSAHTHSVVVDLDSDTHSHGYNTLTNREKARGGGNDRGSNDTHSGRTDFTTTEDTHSHTATVRAFNDGSHNHGNTSNWGGTGRGNTSFDILPPYYTLAFIMRIR